MNKPLEHAEEFDIDPALESLFMPVRDMTDELLRDSIKKHGVRHPLEVWHEGNVLIDGHRRYRICQQLGVPFRITRVSFPSRDAVLVYMRSEQFARRNCTDHEKAIECHKLYQSLQGNTEGDTAQLVSEITGQSVRSVHRKNRYSEAFASMIDGWQEYAVAMKIPQKYIIEIGKCPDRAQQALLNECMKEGNDKPLKHKFGAITVNGSPPRPTIREKAKVTFKTETQPDREWRRRPEHLRVLDLLDEAERAGGAFHRSIGRLFGEHGINAIGSYWKRQIDKSFREISGVLAEVREERAGREERQ